MTQLGPYEVHPFADAFPLIEGAEFDELVQNVKQQGLYQPIVLSADGTTIIDGRNRWRACEVATVDPVFERLGVHYTEPMVLDFIVSANLQRRHLNAGQKAMLALEYKQQFATVTKLGRPIGGGLTTDSEKKTRDPQSFTEQGLRTSAAKAAQVVGVSEDAVVRAARVTRDAPDLAKKVKDGDLALDAADKQRKARVADMPKPEPVAKPGPVMLTLLTHDGKEFGYPKPQGKSTFNQTSGEGISWAQWSWNPVTGCLHGCGYCYAREIATNERYKNSFPAGFAPLFHHERLEAPANTVIPAQYRDDPAWLRVFVCSMADLYGRWVPDEWVQRVHQSMCAAPQWQYITLTKFPARYVGLELPPGAWIGTSVDEQKRVRIAEDAFRQIDGVRVKWLSLEPLLEPVEFEDLSMFDWIVIGGRTATRQPDGPVPEFAPDFEWVAKIVAQAREAGCKVHLKPNLLGRVGPDRPGMKLPDEYPA